MTTNKAAIFYIDNEGIQINDGMKTYATGTYMI